jgi:hypothetical protein
MNAPWRGRVMRGLYHFICLTVVFGFIVLPATEIYGSSVSNRFLMAGVALAGAVYFLKQYFRPRPTFSEASLFFVSLGFIGMAFWAYGVGYFALARMYPALIVFYLVCAKVHIRMNAVDDSLENITRTTKQPVRRIIAFDYRFAVLLGVVMAALAAVILLWVTGPLLSAAGRWYAPVQIEPGQAAYTGPPREMPRGFEPMELPEIESVPYSRLFDVLYYIFGGAAFLWIAMQLLRLVYKALALYLNNRRYKTPSVVAGSGVEEERRYLLPPLTRRKRVKTAEREHEVRRRFRLTVSGNIKKGVPIVVSDTPAQMENKIKTENINALAEEYRRVRYGDPL